MGTSLTTLHLFPGFEQRMHAPRSTNAGGGGQVSVRRGHLLWVCVLLSLAVHVFGIWLADFSPVHHLALDTLVVLDIAAPPVKPVPTPVLEETVQRVEPTPVTVSPKPASVPKPAKTPSPETAMKKKEKSVPVVEKKSVARQAPVAKKETASSVTEQAVSKLEPSVGQVIPREGVTVLANESGMDALKHGSEARFMHGVATEEFVEDNYIGAYEMGKMGRVWIEDDRARSGHLILHAEHMDFKRALFRFNRFIYVYGETSDSPEPIVGSVTFFSDGYHIHQFMWQHNSTYAYFPRRD